MKKGDEEVSDITGMIDYSDLNMRIYIYIYI